MRTLKEEVAYCQSKGFFRNTIELSTMLSWLGEQAVKDYRIAAIESKVLELEAIDAARTSAVQDAIDTAAIYQDQLTASRQQVERLVEALKKIRGVLWATRDLEIIDEALSSIEQHTKGRKS